MAKKYPEFILAIANDYFTQRPLQFGMPLNRFFFDQWLAEVQSYIVLREREHLDNSTNEGQTYKGDRRYRQLLPYTIIRQTRADGELTYVCYRRPAKGGGESRLAGNVSIGWGGHIDFADIKVESSGQESLICLPRTIERAVFREVIREELRPVHEADQPNLNCVSITSADQFILDDSNDVGCLHVGLVMHVDLPGNLQVTTNKKEGEHMEPLTREELLAMPDLENWTRIYLEANPAS